MTVNKIYNRHNNIRRDRTNRSKVPISSTKCMDQKESSPVQSTESYEVEVVRIGTGYRVYYFKDEHSRGFDVGYADRKMVSIPKEVEVKVDSKNTSLIVKGNNKIVVINLVAKIEKVRPVSVYTGNGILRKDKVGKTKRKSTKSTL